MLIRGGLIVTEEGERLGDVLVEGERIKAVGQGLEAKGEEVIDATGLLVLPGVIDVHTHFALDSGTGPTADDFASGSASAAAGGVTTYVNFATQHPGQSFQQALAAVRRQVDGNSHVDYGLHLNVTRLDAGWERDLEEVVDSGVTSAKVYTTYKDSVFYVDDWTIYRLMERSGPAGMLVQIHAENDDMLAGRRRELERAGQTSLAFHGESRPALAESEAVSRGIFFSRATGSPLYFVHLSNPLSVDLVAEAKGRGLPVLAETCPHFLCLDDSVYQRPDAVRFLMTPPIRPLKAQQGMWDRIAMIDSAGSDHCGYSLEQRGDTSSFAQVSSPGIPGAETTLPLLYSFGVAQGRMALKDLARLTAAGPAKIFGLWPRKGSIRPGFVADLVLLDPSRRGPLLAAELHSAAGFSPFEGLQLEARVRTTVARGKVVYDRGAVTGTAGRGRFVERLPFDIDRAARGAESSP